MNSSAKTKRTVGIAIFSAIIVLLQIICTFIKFGPFSITLALAPIIIGAAIYGVGAGAFLGGVFGTVVLVTGLLGWDGGTVLYLTSINAVATVLICVVKGAAAGLLGGLVYRAIAARSELGGVIAAGIVCPVVNTGLFIAGMLLFFTDTLISWAGGQNLMIYLITVLTGINFIVELAVNLILASGISRIIRAARKI